MSAADSRTRALVCKQAAISALINVAFSLAFFLLVFGVPGPALAPGSTEYFAVDFLPQAAAIGLMSALMPVLAVRQTLAKWSGRAPVTIPIVLVTAIGWALVALAAGAVAMMIAFALPAAVIAGRAALAIKLVFGGLLGAAITSLALRHRLRAAMKAQTGAR